MTCNRGSPVDSDWGDCGYVVHILLAAAPPRHFLRLTCLPRVQTAHALPLAGTMSFDSCKIKAALFRMYVKKAGKRSNARPGRAALLFMESFFFFFGSVFVLVFCSYHKNTILQKQLFVELPTASVSSVFQPAEIKQTKNPLYANLSTIPTLYRSWH